jgi:hypothetical protein
LVIGLTPVVFVARAFLADHSGVVEESPPLVTGGNGAVPDVLQIVCDSSGTQVLTPIVRAQPDGLHVLVDDRAGVGSVSIRPTDPIYGDDVILSSASRGVQDEFFDEVAPGAADVVCTGDFLRESEVDTLPWVRFEVVDPGGYFVSYGLDCSMSARHDIADVSGRGSAAELTRTAVDGILPTDRVEQAGYVEGERQNWIRVVRSGSGVASLHFYERSRESRLISGSACAGSGIR